MTEHTAIPWEATFQNEDGVAIIAVDVVEGRVIYTPTRGLVAVAVRSPTEISQDDWTRAQANADFMVKAVNHHDHLVTAVKVLLEWAGPIAGDNACPESSDRELISVAYARAVLKSLGVKEEGS